MEGGCCAFELVEVDLSLALEVDVLQDAVGLLL